MPIKPENKALYPADFPEIAAGVKTAAGWKCEQSAPHGEVIARSTRDKSYMLHDGQVFDENTGAYKGMARGSEYPHDRMIKVVITTAHLDQDPTNNERHNLRALCQQCHNRLDAPYRAAHARHTRLAAKAAGDLFDGLYAAPQPPQRPIEAPRAMGTPVAGLPGVAISIQQPWAWLIVNGFKPIENRDWLTKFRGEILIHAGKKWDAEVRDTMLQGDHPMDLFDSPEEEEICRRFIDEYPAIEACMGGIVGVAEIVDCVSESDSPWFVGRYGFVMHNARPLPFMPLRGQLSLFKCTYLEPPACPA